MEIGKGKRKGKSKQNFPKGILPFMYVHTGNQTSKKSFPGTKITNYFVANNLIL